MVDNLFSMNEKLSYGYLINGYGDKVERKSNAFNKKDAIFSYNNFDYVKARLKLKAEKKSRKNIALKSKQDKINYKNWMKNQYKIQLKEILEDKKKYLSKINQEQDLTNEYKVNLKSLKLEFKKLSHLINENSKTEYQQIRKSFGFKYLSLYKKVKIAKEGKVIFEDASHKSHNAKYIYDNLLLQSTAGDEVLKKIKIIDEEKRLLKTKIKQTDATLTEQEKSAINSKKSSDKAILRQWYKKEKANLKNSNAKKDAFKKIKKIYKFNNKSNKESLKGLSKNQDKIAEYKQKIFNLQMNKNKVWNIYESQVEAIRLAVPVEVSKNKYRLLIILGWTIPGIAKIVKKEYLKGILMLFVSLIFILSLPWVLGAVKTKDGQGIIGLTNFGSTNGKLLDGADSRFYLVTGVIAIILLLTAILYYVVSALENINSSRAYKLGVRSTNYKNVKKSLKTTGLPYLLSAPALIFIIFIIVVPLISTLIISFTNYNQRVTIPGKHGHPPKHYIANGVTHPFGWSGLDNYKYITVVVGKDFWRVLEWTLIWTLSATSLTIFLGTFFAILVNQNRIKGKTFWRIIYILPWAVPGFITILFFSLIFTKYGLFNQQIGKYIFFGKMIDWKNNVGYEKILLIFLQGWLGHSYMFLLITGMLQSIPKSLYESSKISGAKPLKQFITITAPIIIIQIAPLLIGQFVFNFNNFGIIYLFNEGMPYVPGSTAGGTDIFMSWIYKMINSGINNKPGAAAALSLIISVIVVTPSGILFFRSKSFKGGR